MPRTGRPQKYKPEYASIAQAICECGASDKQLARLFHVSKSTINRWKRKYPDFWDSLYKGKAIACGKVAEALYRRAIGYEDTETRTYYNAQGKVYKVEEITRWVHADMKAAQFILQTKYPQFWKK